MTTKFVEYDKTHTVYARQNRKNPTYTEKIMRKSILSDSGIKYKFTRQKPIGPYILDFYCSELLLCLEVDGDSHDDKLDYDIRRDKYIYTNYNIKTIRYSSDDVVANGNMVYDDIIIQIGIRKGELGVG